MRGRRGLTLAAALLLVAGAGGTARGDVLQDLGATFERVAEELRASFPKAEARVVAVDGEEARISGPGVATLRPGLELAAYRKGQLLRHPLTNQPLAHAEEEVGTLVVVAVTGDEAVTRIVPAQGDRTPAVGDGARLTAARIPVAVLPPAGVNVPGETAEQTALLLVSRFSALLEKTGRFLAIDPERVLAASTAGSTPHDVARRLRAAGALQSRLVQEGRSRTLEVAWISAPTESILLTRRVPLVRAVYPPRFAWEQTPELERRHPLEGPVRGVAVADLDGDGRPELVVGDDRGLTIYRWQDGTGLVTVEGGEIRVFGEILSVDAADLTGAGRSQVVLVENRGVGGIPVRSAVIEYREGRLRTLYEVTGRYLRAIPVGRETWLVEQRAGDTEPFDPLIRRLVWEDGGFKDGTALRVPGGASIYGMALLSLTGGAEPEIIAITPEDRLSVWTARGRRIWTSTDAYGGAAVTFPYTPAQETRTQVELSTVIGRVFGRVVRVPEATAAPEILVFENLLPVGAQGRTLMPRLASALYNQGRIHRLRWTGAGFVRVWQSRVTEGYIADFAHGDVDGDGVPEVIVGVVPRGMTLETLSPVGRPRGHLVFYELP
jgi:hypothetical protein